MPAVVANLPLCLIFRRHLQAAVDAAFALCFTLASSRSMLPLPGTSCILLPVTCHRLGWCTVALPHALVFRRAHVHDRNLSRCDTDWRYQNLVATHLTAGTSYVGTFATALLDSALSVAATVSVERTLLDPAFVG
jgi:hypothetical protein